MNFDKYMKIEDIQGNEDVHAVAKEIKYENEHSFIAKDITREEFIEEVLSEIEWYMEFVDPPVNRAILQEAYIEILRIKEMEETRKRLNIDEKEKQINELINSEETNYFSGEMDTQYILEKADENINVTMFSKTETEGLILDLETDEITNIPDWDYSIDEYIFEELERGSKIAYMTLEVHYNIWACVTELGLEEIEFKNGMREYLDYCKRNGISKEYLEKRLDLHEISNIFELYEQLPRKEILNIKYIGIDGWDRPIYKDEKGNIYKDVNLGVGELALHTVANNEINGEPSSPVSNNIVINIIENNLKKEKSKER